MPRRAGLRAALLASSCLVSAALASCSKSEKKNGGSSPQVVAPRPTFSLFALAEVRGQLGPCGCTTDPLGDLGRTAQVIADARKAGPVLV